MCLCATTEDRRGPTNTEVLVCDHYDDMCLSVAFMSEREANIDLGVGSGT